MKFSKLFLIAASLFAAVSFNSCSKSQGNGEKIKVVATIFPVYDWCRQIIGDNPNVELTLLVKNGTDLHSYQPSVKDILTIKNADIFVYVGGESDSWFEDTVEDADLNELQITMNLMQRLKDHVVMEEIVEGMETTEESESEEAEYDEHVWLSIDNAQYICQFILNAMCAKDEVNTAVYTANYNNYITELENLKDEYSNVFAQCRNKTIIICDRFPFRYLTDEFNIRYYAAFAGCSTDAEAGFKTISFLANKLNESENKNVFRLENSTNRLCETVISNSNCSDCKILSLDSMQTTTLDQAQNGKTYLETMRYNLQCIAEAVK